MAGETMSSKERVMAAMQLEKPDRVPIDILASGAPFARMAGITQTEFFSNEEKAFDAINKVFDYTGGWDLDLASIPAKSLAMAKTGITLALGLKLAFPGIELPDDYSYQACEEEVLKPEDYDTIAEIGWQKFMFEDFAFRILDITPEDLQKTLEETAPVFFRAIDEWRKRGVVTLYPVTPFVTHPFFRLSLGRSMVKFTEDLYYNPEMVEKAMKTLTRELIEEWIAGSKIFDQKFAFIIEERAGGFFYPPKIFERFWLPYTLEIVDALWSEGIVTWFHLDACWDKNIPYFKQFPRGSAILALDGTTDIFAAKEVLRNHLCLAGDVHPTLLSIGKPEEVEAYSKRLIDEVGSDGGFILSSGCEIPAAVKAENMRAMIQTGKTYELSKK